MAYRASGSTTRYSRTPARSYRAFFSRWSLTAVPTIGCDNRTPENADREDVWNAGTLPLKHSMAWTMKGKIIKLDLESTPPTWGSRFGGPTAEPDLEGAFPELEYDPAWLDDGAVEPTGYVAECPFSWEDEGRWIPDDGPGVIHQAAPDRVAKAVFYIDADNQSAQSAPDLIALFRDDLGVQVLRAFIAGNDSGRQSQLWADELAAIAPGIESIALDVPCRKDAADLALIMKLGANLEGHARRGELVAVVSRDDLLVGAAERARSQGCRAFAVYVDSDPPCCRSSRVTTFLLPAPTKTRTPTLPAQRLVGTVPSLARIAQTAPDPTAEPAGPEQAEVLARLRALCQPLPAGGYSASDVGQALKRLGFAAPARRHFLANTPGITTEGKATKKVYRF